MEKISHILPPSRRVTSVDLTGTSALRPGVPSFHRPMGMSTPPDKNPLATEPDETTEVISLPTEAREYVPPGSLINISA